MLLRRHNTTMFAIEIIYNKPDKNNIAVSFGLYTRLSFPFLDSGNTPILSVNIADLFQIYYLYRFRYWVAQTNRTKIV